MRLADLGEQPWIELKHALADPRKIGETISAVANAAALNAQPYGYVLWGFEDGTRACVGTPFRPREARVGNEDLTLHLTRMLRPRVELEWFELSVPEGMLVALRIPAPQIEPMGYQGARLCRVGPHNQRLADHPQVEARLWQVLSNQRAEEQFVCECDEHEVVQLLDLDAGAQLLQVPREAVLETLVRHSALREASTGRYQLTAMPLLLIGRDLEPFPRIRRHAPRVVVYTGTERLNAEGEVAGRRGFALGFEGLLDHVMRKLGTFEQYVGGRRVATPVIPELAVREVLGNALIHQDLLVPGAGPLVEVFTDRLEVSNPGRPLANDVRRLLDQPPQSRNEGLATLMRLMGFAEERGSGIDKVVYELEAAKLPSLVIDDEDNRTRVTLWKHREFSELALEDRLWTVYYHACVSWMRGRQPIRNQSVRERFGLEDAQAPTVSRLLKLAVDGGWIRPHGDTGGGRSMAYVPFWAR